MASPEQNFANRENSKHSTGPRTPDGKSTSSNNAKTHGLSAVDPVLPQEDAAQFTALRDDYTAQFNPATPYQKFLVAQLAGAHWKLMRVERIELAMFATLDHNPDDPGATLAQAFLNPDTAAAFTRLERYRANIERTYHRCIRELRPTTTIQNKANSSQPDEKALEEALEGLFNHFADDELKAFLHANRRPRGPATTPPGQTEPGS